VDHASNTPEDPSAFTWDPPSLGDMMPDGYSRITAVFVLGDTSRGATVRVRFGPWWAEFLDVQLPVTNRKAKRLQAKARRRERKLWARSRRCEVGL
jgi:hypothetical protein